MKSAGTVSSIEIVSTFSTVKKKNVKPKQKDYES